MTAQTHEINKIVAARAARARETYLKLNRTGKVNALVYGDFGTGKSTFIATAPKPIWVHNFDPGGMTTSALQPLIERGDIIVTDYSFDSLRDPQAFRRWEQEMNEMGREGVFERIGTYCLDSLTKWADVLMNDQVRKGGFKNDCIPQQKDYLTQQIIAVDVLGKLCALPCNVLVTGHIALDKNEVTGAIETGLNLAGKLAAKVPLVFDEKWITRVRQSPSGTEFLLQTHSDGYFKAETRMGGPGSKGEPFLPFEKPDFRALLVKAGRLEAAKDKPSLFTPEA